MDWLKFTPEEVSGFVRHIMTTAGGAMVATSSLNPTDWQTIVGAVATVSGIIWSVWQKRSAV